MPEERTKKVAWNKGKKMNYSSEHIANRKAVMKKRTGMKHPRAVPIGTVHKTGNYKEIKTKSGWIREHHYVWQKYKWLIPKNYVIHHINFNKYHNAIENLVCMPDAEHRALHLKLRVIAHA